MTTCRTTPAIQKHFAGTCIYQILIDASLTACRIEPYPEPVFVRRLGHYWVVSTTSTTQCHSATISDPDQYQVMDNHVITLPPTALITTIGSTPLSCDLFYLPELPMQLETKIVLYQNSTIDPMSTKNSFIYTR